MGVRRACRLFGGGVQHGAGKGVRGTRMGGGDQQRSGRGVHSPARPLLAAAAHSSAIYTSGGRPETGMRGASRQDGQ